MKPERELTEMKPERIWDSLMNAWRDGDLEKANHFTESMNTWIIEQRKDSFAMYLIYGIALQALDEYESVLERLKARGVDNSI